MADGIILIVEDDALIAAHMESVLAAAGYTVLPPLAFGEEAVAVVVARPPDLVLMDIVLAGEMDGIAAAGHIQAHHDIPVVYLTAFTQDERLQRARATNPYGYLTKPVSGHELLATIDMVLYRHAADRRLRESEARYRTLVENIPGVVCISAVEPPWPVQYMSDEALALTGRPADDFLAGRVHWGDIVLPEDLPRLVQVAAAAVQEHRPFTLEYRIRHTDGSLRWVKDVARIVYEDDGTPLRLDGINLDITEWKRLEAERDAAMRALRQREAYLSAIIDNLPGVVWLKDREGRFLALNRAHSVPSGLDTPERVVGKTDMEILPREQAERYRAEDAAIMESGQSLCVEERIFDRGEYKWVQKYKTPIRDADGVIIGTTGYSHDITSLKRAAEERSARQWLETEKARSLSVLAGHLTHEFNNLLQAIVGELDLVLSDAATDAGARMRIESALQAVGRAVSLTHRRLTHAGAGQVRFSEVALDRLVDENRRLFEVALGPRTAFQATWPDGVPPLWADAALLRLALLHLVTNAAEAIGDAPGCVTVSAGVVDCDTAYLSRSCVSDKPPAGRYVCVEVADTGPGMDAATRQQVVEPGLTTWLAGRGLGIPVVTTVMRSHGGAVVIDSQPGHGTSVRLLFPVSTPVTDGLPVLVAHEKRPGTTWLVMEADDHVRQVAIEALRHLGHAVLVAANCTDALQLFQAHGAEVSAALVDLTMPGVDGVTTCAVLRRLRPDLPVILTSSYDEAEIAARFSGRASTVFLQKPWRLEAFATAVRAALDMQSEPSASD
jgi:PAS domain S-box-containing protein